MAEALYRFNAATNTWIKVTDITQIVVEGGGGVTEPIVFEINVTVANTELFLQIGQPYHIQVSWGDGSVYGNTKRGSDVEIVSHIYQPGDYTVTIEGFCVSFRIAWQYQAKKIISNIISFGSVATSLSDCMAYETTISEIQQGVMPSKNYRLTNFTAVFNECRELATLPADLIADSFITSAANAFVNCKKLTSIPANFFRSLVLNTNYMFSYCTGLTSLPPFLFNGARLTANYDIFFGCTGLTSLPDDLFNGCLGLGSDRMFKNTNLATISPYTFRGFLGTSLVGLFIDCVKLTSLPSGLFNGLASVTSVSNLFSGCVLVNSLPYDFFYGLSAVNTNYMFSYCTGLTSLPPFLFSGIKLTANYDIFFGCTGLTSLPDDLFNGCLGLGSDRMFKNTNLATISPYTFRGFLGTTLSGIFIDCVKLTSLPANLFDGLTLNINYLFSYCTGLTSLSPFLFKGAEITNNYDTFYGCTGLTSLPDDLFNGCLRLGNDRMFKNTNLATISPYTFRGFLGTTLGSIFIDCVKLTSIPNNLFEGLPNLKNTSSLFQGCTGLTSIPANLFDNTNIESVNYMFNGCTNITGPVPELWNNPQFTNYYQCFRGCTKASNYASIPASWK